MSKRVKIKPRLPLEDSVVDEEKGLSREQIDERVKKKYVNNVKIGTSKSVLNIIVSNTCSFFNFLCILIFIWILSITISIQDGKLHVEMDGIKNCTFMVIIFINIIIGIVQELRAKRTMDKLSLLSSPKVTVLREGEEKSIAVNEILLDDIMLLDNGNQVCSDSVIIDGSVEVNESLLTGESDAIVKNKGDKLLSGSFIVSGKCKVRVEHIGEENYVQGLAIEAKQYKPQQSQLLKSLNTIMRILTVIILLFAVPTFLNNFNFRLIEEGSLSGKGLFYALGMMSGLTKETIGVAYEGAVNLTATGLIGMIPAGLFLLTSIALAVGVVRLSKKNALVQGLYSIETLARVDTLCLDKTGTITDGTMKVSEVAKLTDKLDDDKISEIVLAMERALGDNNATSKALCDYFTIESDKVVDFIVPFSSDRKRSIVKFQDDDMYVIGAPEYVIHEMDKELEERIEKYQLDGYRCLLLASTSDKKSIEERDILGDVTPIAIIVIEDNIKKDAIETIKYFNENDVEVRVISGDNPITVSQVAKRVGIKNAENYVSLQGMTDDEVRSVAMDHMVFGRVNPAQKKLLVKIFQSHGRTVAMTGDGINDILALKEADCSIAMANGSEATRNVAQLVLMDSNFGSMPSVVGEGRRVVNNIERASALFLMKTLFTFVIQLILIFSQKALPLEPVQLSFISLFGVGIPSFILALEPNNNRIKGKFVSNIFKRILPASLTMDVTVLLTVFLVGENGLVHATYEQQSTMVMIVMLIAYLLMIFHVCQPFNKVRIALMVFVSIASTMIVVISSFIPLDNFINIFMVASLTGSQIGFLFGIIAITIVLMEMGRFIVKRVDESWQAAKVDMDIATASLEGEVVAHVDEEISIKGMDKKDLTKAFFKELFTFKKKEKSAKDKTKIDNKEN